MEPTAEQAVKPGSAWSRLSRRRRILYAVAALLLIATVARNVWMVASKHLRARQQRADAAEREVKAAQDRAESDLRGRQTDQLPAIDRVEVFLLSDDGTFRAAYDFGIGDLKGVVRQRSVDGTAVDELASIWRTRLFESSDCSIQPRYAIRMYQGDRQMFETMLSFLDMTVVLEDTGGKKVVVKMRDPDDALLSWFERELPMERTDRDALAIEMIKDAITKGERDKVVAYLDDADKRSPGEYKFAHLRAWTEYLWQGPEAGIEAFSKVLNKFGDRFEARYYRGVSHYELLEFQEALDDFLKATELIEAQDFYLPASFVHYQRGVTRLAMKKYEEAIVDFTQAIDGYEYEGGAAVAPISYYKNRAEAYRGLGLEDKAREDETRTGRLF